MTDNSYTEIKWWVDENTDTPPHLSTLARLDLWKRSMTEARQTTQAEDDQRIANTVTVLAQQRDAAYRERDETQQELRGCNTFLSRLWDRWGNGDDWTLDDLSDAIEAMADHRDEAVRDSGVCREMYRQIDAIVRAAVPESTTDSLLVDVVEALIRERDDAAQEVENLRHGQPVSVTMGSTDIITAAEALGLVRQYSQDPECDMSGLCGYIDGLRARLDVR